MKHLKLLKIPRKEKLTIIVLKKKTNQVHLMTTQKPLMTMTIGLMKKKKTPGILLSSIILMQKKKE